MPGSGPSCKTACHLGGASSKHPADWTSDITQHGAYVAVNISSGCANASCHGPALEGANGPSCSSCHLGGAASVHPASWGTGTEPALGHASYVTANGVAACRNSSCHGPSLAGISGSGPSCSSCHLGGATSAHPASWGTGTELDLSHASYVTANGAATCRNNYCHGSSLAGVAGSGPACSTSACHQNGSPVAMTGCSSCHDSPPAGSAAPNERGAHAKHNALPGVTGVCDTCHSGAGTGKQNHFNGRVELRLLGAYNAKSGETAYNADGTCSNVSCHGGKTTPAWSNGAITTNVRCISCHELGTAAGTPQYNSYYSGGHFYMVFIATCDACHDTAKLAADHFTSLKTPAMEGPASETILSSLTYSPSGTAGVGVFTNPEPCGACRVFPIQWQ